MIAGGVTGAKFAVQVGMWLIVSVLAGFASLRNWNKLMENVAIAANA